MTSGKFRTRSRKLLLLGLGVLLAAWILFSPFGWLRYRDVQESLAEIKARNSRLAEENDSLRREIVRLREDPAYIAEVARKQYGFLRKNELLFLFGEKGQKE